MIVLAQIDVLKPSVEAVFGFIFLTLAFLVLSAIVVRRQRSQEARLMLLGILVAIAGIGYATMIAMPTVSLVAPSLMKIAVILVLGSVACSVLSYSTKGPAAQGPQEPPHV